MNDARHEALTYVSQGPDIQEISASYHETIAEIEYYRHQCRLAHDERHNYWPGKTWDHKKAGADAFPWEGASDLESYVIGERCNKYVAKMVGALRRAHIRAYPVEVGDMARARLVSSFLKWMQKSYIRDFYTSAELGANHLVEKGLLVTYVGWERQKRSILQRVSLDQIAQQSRELAELMADPANEDEVATILQQLFPGIKRRRARKAAVQLRSTGVAEIPTSVTSVDRPVVETLAPDNEVFFSPFTSDIQRSPYVHRRVLLTPQEIEGKVATEGWDREWADHVIEHCRGDGLAYGSEDLESARAVSPVGRYQRDTRDLIEVIHTYQRLIDPDDGSEGIYISVWCPHHTADNAHADFELMNGWDQYPFLATPIAHSSKRLYDQWGLPDLLRGTQWQVKTQRDARSDRASITTLPPAKGPLGRPRPDYHPGGYIGERRQGEYSFADVPPFDPGSMEIETTMLNQADRLVGLDPDDPASQDIQAFYLTKYLEHYEKVLGMAYKAYGMFGPEQMFFRVTGLPDSQEFKKSPQEEKLDICIGFDALNNDPESVEKRLEAMASLVQYDTMGQIDSGELIRFMAGALDPMLADHILRPVEEGARQAQRETIEDMAAVMGGADVGARPGAPGIRLQTIQQILQQPDIQQAYANNEAYRERVDKMAGQYQFQMQQAQNAQIGRIGTAPGDMQGAQQ
jgi:hypothetical protein